MPTVEFSRPAAAITTEFGDLIVGPIGEIAVVPRPSYPGGDVPLVTGIRILRWVAVSIAVLFLVAHLPSDWILVFSNLAD